MLSIYLVNYLTCVDIDEYIEIFQGRSAKKAQSGNIGQSEEHYKKAPHTFVIPRGHVGKNVNELIRDMRKVMEPYTASRLKVSGNPGTHFLHHHGYMHASVQNFDTEIMLFPL